MSASRRRWIGAAITLGVLGAAFFVVFVAPFLAVRNDPIRAWILEPGRAGRFLPPGWTLSIQSVGRFSPGGIQMKGIRISDTREGRREVLLALGSLDLDMEPAMFLRRRIVARHLLIDSLAFRLDMEPPKRAEAPDAGARADKVKPGGKLEIPWMQIDSVSIRRVEAWRSDTLVASASIALGRVEHRAGKIDARLGSLLAWMPSESLGVSLVGGDLEATTDGALGLSGARHSSDGLFSGIDIGGEVSPGEGVPPRGRLEWRIHRIVPAHVVPLRRRGLAFESGDSLHGIIRAEGDASDLVVSLGLAGSVWDSPVDTLWLIAAMRGKEVRIDELNLWHRAVRLRAEGDAAIDSLRFSGRVDLRGLDLGDPILARWIGERPRTSIDAHLQGRAELGGDSPRVDGQGDLERVRVIDRDYGPIQLAGRIDGGAVAIDSLVVGPGGAVLSVAGTMDAAGGLDGRVEVRRFALEEWIAPWIGVPLEGAVAGNLVVSGSRQAPLVRGRLESGPFRVVEVYADRVDVDSVRMQISPLKMDAHIRSRSLDIFKFPADSARIDFEWDGHMRADVEARLDSLVARSEVEIVPAEPGSLRVDWLSLDPGSLAPWQATIPARVAWARGAARIENVRFESTDGSIEGDLDVGARGSFMDGEARIRDVDLDVVRKLLALPDSSLSGLVDADVEIGGTADDPAFRGAVRGRRLVGARWPMGSLVAAVRVESEGPVAVDSLLIGRGEGYGTARADALLASLPVNLTRFFEGGTDSVAARLTGVPISGRISFDSLSLNRIARSALVPSNGGRSGILAEPIDPMSSRIVHTNLAQRAEPSDLAEGISGTLRGTLEIDGTATAPRIDLEGMLESVRLYQASADSLLFSVAYEPEQVVLDSLVWIRAGRASRAQGSFPLALSMAPSGTKILRDRPLRLDAELPDIDLAILGAISRQIQEPGGMLNASLRLRGTPSRMWPEGKLVLRDGTMRIPQREERLNRIEGILNLDSTGVAIESLEGSFGKEGSFEMVGTFRDLEHFDLQASVRDAQVFETGLYRFTVDGDFSAYPVVSPLGSYPQVVGSVLVREGVIVGDLAKAPPPPTGAGRKPSPWRAEIDVRAPGDIRLSTAVATVEMGEGDLHVSFVDPLINVSGGIEVLGGRYRVFNNIFNITSGTVEFRDMGRGPEPILDVGAETRVTDAGAGGEAAQDITVELKVTGPLTALELEFNSTPDRTQDEIIELLSIGRLTDPSTGTLGVADPSRQYLFTELVSQVESQISQLIVPLQNVSVQPGVAPGEAWRLNVRQNVMSQVSVAYSRELETTADEEISLRYNLGGKLYLNAGLERRQTQAGSATDRYSLDLKLRFEYK